MAEPTEDDVARMERDLEELSKAMYAVIERRLGREHLQAVVMLDDPTEEGMDSIAVFGYPNCGNAPVHVVENVCTHLVKFGASFGNHIDVYVNGVRLTTGRASPNAS